MQIETNVPCILPHKNYQIGKENNDSGRKKFAGTISNSNICCHFKTISNSMSYNFYLNLQPQVLILVHLINNELGHLKIEHKPNRVDWCFCLPKFSSLNHQASTGWPKSKFEICFGYNSENKRFWPYVGKAKMSFGDGRLI